MCIIMLHLMAFIEIMKQNFFSLARNVEVVM